MIKSGSQLSGMIGSVVGMVLMPCCFPFVLSIFTYFGLTSISMGPMTPYFVAGSAVLMTLGHSIVAYQTHRYWIGALSVFASLSIMYYTFLFGDMWRYYGGLIVLFVLSMYLLITSRMRSSRHCHHCV